MKKLPVRKLLGQITQHSEERDASGVGVFICVKTYITCGELWLDEVCEMIAVEVNAWEIVGIYRAPNEDMLVRKTGRLDQIYEKNYEA